MGRELRIIGPPGTGKTTYLRKRVEATIATRGETAIRIASLTRAAAAEIADRVNLPRENVGTLHALAYRALEQPDLAETPDGLREWNKRAHLYGEAYVIQGRRGDAREDMAGEAMTPSTEGEGLLQWYATARAKLMPREEWPPMLVKFAAKWEAFKHETDRFDFNDLIERAINELPTLPGCPSVFLLDEAQDMSALDMRLARQWGAACEVFVIVGDPDQNLYGFRGADPAAFNANDEADVQVLDRSYRVPAAVHTYATDWIAEWLPSRTRAAYHPRLEDDGTPAVGKLTRGAYTSNSPELLVNRLVEQLAAGERVMVLATCGFHLDPLVAILRRRGIPFGNPYRATDGRLNPLAGASRLRAYLAGLPAAWGGEDRNWTWDEVRLWAEPLKASGVFQRGGKSFVDVMCQDLPGDRMLSETRRRDRVAEWDEVMSLLTDEARLHLGLGDVSYYAANLLKSQSGGLAYTLAVYGAYGAAAVRSAPGLSGPGIIVGTVHSVKGGEADCVYVFPDLSRQGFDGWLDRGARHDAVARTFYVAFTRARHELVLCQPSSAYNVPLEIGE